MNILDSYDAIEARLAAIAAALEADHTQEIEALRTRTQAALELAAELTE